MKTRTEHALFTCRWVVTIRDGDGPCAPIVGVFEHDNFLTELGEAHIAARLSGTPTQMSHMAIGTGTGQDQADQTLTTEIARVALEATYPLQGTGANDNRVSYYAIYPSGTGTGTISEFAIFNASSGGVMLNYASGFTPYVKGASQSFEITAYLKAGTT